MSHFTVLALSRSTDEIGTLLAPYDENEPGEPRWELVAPSPKEWWMTENLIEDGKLPDEPSWTEVVNAFNAEYPSEAMVIVGPGYSLSPDAGANVHKIEDGKLYSSTTYNELSKWDWYQIGGRWSGRLLLKEGRSGSHGTRSWGNRDEPEAVGRCDSARKGDLDIEAMRTEEGDAAAVRWDKYDALRKQHGEPDVSWLEDLRAKDDEARVEKGKRGRTAYWNHPLMVAAKDEELIGFMGPISEFDVPRDVFVERARLRALPGYATLDGLTPDPERGTPGTWIEQGQMGWFGMDDSTPDSEMAYLKAANAAIDAAPDDAWLTLIDLHI